MKIKAYESIKDAHPKLFDNSNALIKIIEDSKEILSWQKQRRIDFRKKALPAEWSDIGIVFSDPKIMILRDLVEFSNGYRNGYIRLYNRAYLEGAAAGVAILPEMHGKLLLTHHFRHATRAWHWEIPRGFGEPGVTADMQARNEVYEEVAGSILNLIDLGTFYNNTGLEGHPVNLFLARMGSVGNPDNVEGIARLNWVLVTELEQMIADGEITDGFTIAAYTKAKLKGLI